MVNGLERIKNATKCNEVKRKASFLETFWQPSTLLLCEMYPKLNYKIAGREIAGVRPVFQSLFSETHFVSVVLSACLSRLDAITDGIGVHGLAGGGCCFGGGCVCASGVRCLGLGAVA